MPYPESPRATPSARAAAALLCLCSLWVVAGGAPAARAQSAKEVVAEVGGRPVTLTELDDSAAAQLFPLRQQMHAVRKAALENLILRRVLEDEARRRGISVEELKRHLSAGPVEVTPEQVEAVYLEHASAFGSMSPDEARERIRLDLESQSRMRRYREAVARLRAKAAVELRLEEPRLSPAEAESPAQGPQGAAVVITEFSDFLCRYCKESQAAIRELLKSYGQSVRLVFRHLPAVTQPRSLNAARAAFCAGRQGRFWQYHDALFASPDPSQESLEKLGAEVGLEPDAFKACLASEESANGVLADVREAARLGIQATPTLLVNGRPLRGSLSFNVLREVIEQEVKSAKTFDRRE